MAGRPTKITSLTSPEAVKTLNTVVEDINRRLNNVENASQVKRISSVSSLHFGTIPANSCVQTVINLPEATTNLVAHANPILSLGSTNLTWSAFVSAAGQVTVRVANPTTSPIAVNTVRWNILVS